ncbi:hypothetical protein HN681_04380 [archaeon]|jgi:uncharacterized HAD superfamily protein|nr:hypothetical protein [archaeon]MBT3730641.1 hypothetical protein [archaeon]MBT4669543.1 hypothetical protein [archaeon]MBT5030300.1 hypothetical protein [archaeon]MBT5288407.1 hypothetical protein [archaeon]
MLIGVDMDDVIFPYNRGFLLFHNANFGTHLRREQFRHFSYKTVLESVGTVVTDEEVSRRIMAYESSVFFRDRDVIPGSKNVLRHLKENNHDLVIITSRREELLGITGKWIKKNFSGIFNDVYFASRDPRIGGKSKYEYCYELGVDVLLEDQFENALLCEHAVQRCVYLFDAPWNRPWQRIGSSNKSSKLPTGVIRVKGWSDIRRYL